MPESRVNQEVFCKRNGARGIIVSESDDVVIIQTNGVNKSVTRSTFKRWYTIVPRDKEKTSESSCESSQNVDNESSSTENSKRNFPLGNDGVGVELRERFIEIVKSSGTQNLDFTYDSKNNRDIIKYNGRNVFECTTARRRFNVLCHSKALTPDNLKRADRVFPKEWGWSLNVKFVFTNLSQTPLMRSIITDSLFYRHKEEE